MKVYRSLEIHGTASQLTALPDLLESQLRKGWSRDKEVEQEMSRDVQQPVACFRCEADKGRPAARLWLHRANETRLRLSNIVPIQVGQLTYDQFNSIAAEFVAEFVDPLKVPHSLQVELSSADATITDWISPGASEKLRVFSDLANKTTGSSHWCDRERWLDFILTVYREGRRLPTDVFRRWLNEELGWDEEGADRLVIEFSFALQVLEYYVAHGEA